MALALAASAPRVLPTSLPTALVNHIYEIGFLQGAGILGHKVVEVLSDGVVIEDVAGLHQTRIPIYSIKSVVITNAGGAK